MLKASFIKYWRNRINSDSNEILEDFLFAEWKQLLEIALERRAVWKLAFKVSPDTFPPSVPRVRCYLYLLDVYEQLLGSVRVKTVLIFRSYTRSVKPLLSAAGILGPSARAPRPKIIRRRYRKPRNGRVTPNTVSEDGGRTSRSHLDRPVDPIFGRNLAPN